MTGPFSAGGRSHSRLSLVDRSVTFGATTRVGVCVALWQPVATLSPRWLLAYPEVTLTVDRPVELTRLLRRGRPGLAVRAGRLRPGTGKASR